MIVSNCVLNLVPNKDGVFKEIRRVLKPGGHFSISDIVLVGSLPQKIREAAEMYAGCVAGAIQKQAYLELIKMNGFKNVVVQKEKPIIVPDDILSNYLSEDEIREFKSSGTGIYSITVYAEKERKPAAHPDVANNYLPVNRQENFNFRIFPVPAAMIIYFEVGAVCPRPR